MSEPTWQLTIPKGFTYIGDTGDAYVIAGTGQPPVAEVSPPPPGEPADPPLPLETDYSPQPGEDTSAFAFPTGGPTWPTDPNGDRNYPLDRDGTIGAGLYAAEGNAGNPLLYSLRNAGFIAEGGRTSYGRAVGGLRLWAPTDTPPHLLRRALKQGHL